MIRTDIIFSPTILKLVWVFYLHKTNCLDCQIAFTNCEWILGTLKTSFLSCHMKYTLYTDLYLPLQTEQLTLLRNFWEKTNTWEFPNRIENEYTMIAIFSSSFSLNNSEILELLWEKQLWYQNSFVYSKGDKGNWNSWKYLSSKNTQTSWVLQRS